MLLTSFQCDALIALKGIFHQQGSIGVIIEYMDRGSLEFLLRADVHLTEPVMAAIAFQIIWGLGYLHYEKQIHRDIKPANILMVGACTRAAVGFLTMQYFNRNTCCACHRTRADR